MDKQKWEELLAKTGPLEWFLGLGVLCGVVLVGWGVLQGIVESDQVQVEYLTGDKKQILSSKIVVDIAGAVEKPGVYSLDYESRVKDVIIMAGGLSKTADRNFVTNNMNMAEKLKDGQKILIPSVNNSPSGTGYVEAKVSSKTININTATLSQLDTLWGIGEVKASEIIKNRPYVRVEELVEKKIVNKSVLEKNSGLISVY